VHVLNKVPLGVSSQLLKARHLQENNVCHLLEILSIDRNYAIGPILWTPLAIYFCKDVQSAYAKLIY